METLKMPKGFKVYLPLLILWVLLFFLLPKAPKLNFDYRKGTPWMDETLVAQFDFPILKTDEEILSEYGGLVDERIPYYTVDPDVIYDSELRLSDVDLGIWSSSKVELMETVHFIYSKGVISDLDPFDNASETLSEEDMIYVQRGRSMAKVPVSEVFTVDTAKEYLRMSVATSCTRSNVDSLIASSGLYGLIMPNLKYDSQMTEMINEDRAENISRTSGIVRSGQVIVNEGEIVTADIEKVLDSYREEYSRSIGSSDSGWLQWLGYGLISLSIVLVLFLGILFSNPEVFVQFNKYLYLLMIFAISAFAASYAARSNPMIFYMMPFSLIALYLLAFFKKRVVFTVYIISLLPVLLFASNGVELFTIYLVAGVVCILVFGYFNKGWLQFVTAFIVFLTMAAVWLSFEIINSVEDGIHYYVIGYMALAAFLTVAGYPLIFLFEKLFALVSHSRLADLCDTGNPLLRLLADKAPGTFQHSLQVMNLADAAARTIDADIPLVRAGALYHDIGKILNPQCFTENQAAGVRYHEGLSPKESARDIIKHVSDGLAMAEKDNLPKVIREFISTHHGTGAAGYFLTTYLNEGGDPEDVADFYYNGVKPSSKEQVILMICDSVEAASRSLKDYSSESISGLVDNIVQGKIDSGQLSESDITLKEITLIKQEIKSYLQQMYHSRVAYPKRQQIPQK